MNNTVPKAQTENNDSTSPVDVGSGAKKYTDDKDVYSFLYPVDYILDTNDPQHIRVYKTGETQRPQSEMSDGALIVFEVIDLGETSLDSWVDSRIEESLADGTSEITETKRPFVLNTFPGFSYALRGLGNSQNIILQKNITSNEALSITYAISDPQQKNYQQEINSILSSITFL